MPLTTTSPTSIGAVLMGPVAGGEPAGSAADAAPATVVAKARTSAEEPLAKRARVARCGFNAVPRIGRRLLPFESRRSASLEPAHVPRATPMRQRQCFVTRRLAIDHGLASRPRSIRRPALLRARAERVAGAPWSQGAKPLPPIAVLRRDRK